jgi:hypothetical protein
MRTVTIEEHMLNPAVARGQRGHGAAAQPILVSRLRSGFRVAVHASTDVLCDLE